MKEDYEKIPLWLGDSADSQRQELSDSDNVEHDGFRMNVVFGLEYVST